MFSKAPGPPNPRPPSKPSRPPGGIPPPGKAMAQAVSALVFCHLGYLSQYFSKMLEDLKASSKPRLKLIFALAPWTKRKAYAHFMPWPYLSMFYLNQKLQLDPYSCNVCNFRYRFDNDCQG